jgi:hypothetical protein
MNEPSGRTVDLMAALEDSLAKAREARLLHERAAVKEKPMDEVLAELRWLIDNTDGVVGLKESGGTMPWAQVLALYMPTFRSQQLGHADG